MAGERLGHFELLDYVGGGGMGRVFRARDLRLNRVVALKILVPEQAADPNTLQRFQTEAQSTAKLDHPNIARVYYVGEDRGIPFIVFEFVEGMNIRDLVAKKGPLPLAEALSYTLQVTEGLSHAASREVVHRDIKPSNVLVTAQGIAKLIDLGLARLQRWDGPAGELTATGVTLGTFDYISPEQARDPRIADVRSDIYSLGCTFFYMLTGRPPFPEGTMLQKLLQHQGDQPPDVRQFRGDLPEELSRVLRKMLAKDPRHRYQDPTQLAEELLVLAQQVGMQPLRANSIWSGPRSEQVSFWERHLPWMAPTAALLCIVLILDLATGRRNEPLPPPQITAGNELEGLEPYLDQGPAMPEENEPKQDAPAATGAAAMGPVNDVPEPAAGIVGQPPAEAKPAPLQSPPTPPAETALAGTPAPRTAAKPSGLIVVADQVSGDKEYTSLTAACSAAVNGDVIELRYNGRREYRPISLTNVRLTIRGAEGFRPVIAFLPTDTERFRQAMITVSASRLTLINLVIELDLPRDLPAERWSLFELLGGELIRLEKCWLTIRNPMPRMADYPQDVSFFRLRPPPGAELLETTSAPSAPAAIRLENCVARGEAVFLRADNVEPVDLTWENGLLATSECLLASEGGRTPPTAGNSRQITLQHLTAVLRRGLCRLSVSSSAPHQLMTRFQAFDNILVGAPTASLVELSGTDSSEDCQAWLEWNGVRNFYQGWNAFWSFLSADSRTPQTIDFNGWLARWGQRESLAESNQVLWRKRPADDRAAHTLLPADFALNESATPNPARQAASDGDDVGMKVETIPPAAETAEAASKPTPHL